MGGPLPIDFINQRGSAFRFHQPNRHSINKKGPISIHCTVSINITSPNQFQIQCVGPATTAELRRKKQSKQVWSCTVAKLTTTSLFWLPFKYFNMYSDELFKLEVVDIHTLKLQICSQGGFGSAPVACWSTTERGFRRERNRNRQTIILNLILRRTSNFFKIKKWVEGIIIFFIVMNYIPCSLDR